MKLSVFRTCSAEFSFYGIEIVTAAGAGLYAGGRARALEGGQRERQLSVGDITVSEEPKIRREGTIS